MAVVLGAANFAVFILSLLHLWDNKMIEIQTDQNEIQQLDQFKLLPLPVQPSMGNRAKYIRLVFETALFFREIHEEGQGGHSMAINLLKPVSIRASAIRKFVLHGLYASQNLSLTDAAIQLSVWQPEGKAPPFDAVDIEEELRALCAEHEREIRPVTDKGEILDRSLLRLARYIRRILTEGTQAHSRVVEIFVPDDLVPRGFGKNGRGYREHVVPCVILRDACLDLIKQGWKTEDIAGWVRPYIAVVEITTAEAKRLDGSKSQGGVGLKNSMPKNWSFDTGCIFARLHEAEIEFDLPSGYPACTH